MLWKNNFSNIFDNSIYFLNQQFLPKSKMAQAEVADNLASNLTNLDPKTNDEEVNFADIFKNLKEEDLIRGTTPDDIEKRCLELCQTYIGGSWSQVKNIKTDITVSRIAGGLTNQLYRVQLNESVNRIPNAIYSNEPRDVAIKLYQAKHMKTYHQDDDERLNDIIVLTILSEVKIGPKVYGIFSDGVIQEFVEVNYIS